MHLSIPMAERVVQRNPQIQKPQSRHQTAHRAVGCVDPKRGELHKQRVLVPELSGPRHIADRQANVHPQQYPQKQLGAHQPARNPLRRVLRLGWGRGLGLWPWLCSRAYGELRRGRFRLLRHSESSHTAPDSSPIAGIWHRPIHRPGAGTPYCNGNTATTLAWQKDEPSPGSRHRELFWASREALIKSLLRVSIPSGAKARVGFAAFAARLKPCHCKTRLNQIS